MAKNKLSSEEINHKKRINDDKLERVLRMGDDKLSSLRKTLQEKVSNIEITGGKRNKKTEFLLLIKDDIDDFIKSSIPFKQISIFIKNIFGVEISSFDLRSFAIAHLGYVPKVTNQGRKSNSK